VSTSHAGTALPEPARAALDRGDGDDPALQLALRSIAQAEAERGA